MDATNITTFFKVISHGNLSSVSIKNLILPNFSTAIIFKILSDILYKIINDEIFFPLIVFNPPN